MFLSYYVWQLSAPIAYLLSLKKDLQLSAGLLMFIFGFNADELSDNGNV